MAIMKTTVKAVGALLAPALIIAGIAFGDAIIPYCFYAMLAGGGAALLLVSWSVWTYDPEQV